MPRPLLGWVRLLLVVAGGLTPLLLLGPGVARAAGTADKPAGAEKSAAELLPASTLFYAEIAEPKKLIGLVLDNPAVARVTDSPQYRAALDAPQYKEFMAALGAVEQRAGVKWRPALEAITGGGVVIAIEPSTQGGLLMVRSADVKTTAAVRDALMGLARDDAKAKGKPDPVSQETYRELTTYRSAENTLLEMGPWLVSTNKPALATIVADAYLDGPADGASLAESEEFVAARALIAGTKDANPATPKPSAWGFVRLPPLRLLALNQPWMKPGAKSDNPGAELILGGLVGVVQKAPYAAMSLDASTDGLRLRVAAPHDPSWVPEERRFYFAPAAERGGAAPPLRPKGTVLSLTTYRDVAAMWQHGPDLFTEGVAAEMAKADSGLSTFLGGKSFGTDVLGALKPQAQFIVAAQDYKAAGVPEPGIKIPAFASVFRLKPEEAKAAGLRRHLRVAFQSIVALGNLDGAAKNRPMLEMQTEKRGDAEIHYAVYEQADAAAAETDVQAKPAGEPAAAEAPKDAADAKAAAVPAPAADIHYNFSPALVISPDYLMFCSTKQIAQDLADLIQAEKQAGKSAATIEENTNIGIDAPAVAKLIRDNREQLIAQNMLEKGHDRPAAEREIDFLVAAVEYLRSARLKLTPTDKTIALEIEVKTALGK